MQLYTVNSHANLHERECSFNTFMHTWFRSIWVLREPFPVEEHCTGTIWPLVSEHSHFHTTSYPLVNKIHYLSYSDHRLKTIMSNIIVIRFHRGSCLSGTKIATPIWRCEPAFTHNLAIMETFTCVLSTATSEHNMIDYEICSSSAWPWADTEVHWKPLPI